MGFTAIIPAAGKGTRVGSPVDGKELMMDPMTGRPLIDFAILAAEDAGCDKIVVAIQKGTKPLLQAHLANTFPAVVVHLTEPANEWPDTVLQTKDHWDDFNNIVILPDTRYNTNELKHLCEKHAEGVDTLTFACLPGKIMEPEKFGIIALHEFSLAPLFTVEKPTSISEANITAWGLIAFNKHSGYKLFTAYSTRGQIHPLSASVTQLLYLSWFKDVTRNGYVETY